MILLDTNVISELAKAEPFPAVADWARQYSDQLALSTIALGELWYGVEKLEPGKRREVLVQAMERLTSYFAGRIYSFDADAARAYGLVLAAARAKGRPMSVPDGQIAAIALTQKAKLATRNVRDFATVKVAVINPWEDS